MKKVLYILKHNPWGIGGGCYASNLYLTAFLEVFKDYQFDILLCDYCLEMEHPTYNGHCHFIPVVPRGKSKILSVFTGIMHRYQKQGRKMLSSYHYDYCIFDHSQIAGSLIPYVPTGTKSIVLHHNFEQKYYRDNTPSCLHRILFSKFVAKWERNAFLNCAFNVFLTKEDLGQFRDFYGKEKGTSIIGGIFDFNTMPAGDVSMDKELTCVITGSLDNVQNVDGLRYFFDQLYPLFPKQIKIIIAGKNPSPAIYDLVNGGANVKIVANPQNMASVISKGQIYLCPTRLGSGIKVRITDGLRAGLPVIAHKVSARGYSDFIEKGFMLSFESKEEFADALRTMINRIDSNPGIYQDIRSYYVNSHSFACGVSKLKIVLKQ